MKADILTIATRQMKRGGYEKLNFASIAEELGTSRANLHHHFKNKEGLGVAVMEDYVSVAISMMEENARKYDGDILGFLKSIEDHMMEVFVESTHGNACIGSQLLHDSHAPEGLRTMARKFFQDEIALVQNQLEKAVLNGELEPESDLHSLGFRIATIMHGVGQMGLLVTEGSGKDPVIKGALTSLLD